MPKHGFRFPREVIDAVREHVSQAIHRIEPERFSQEANYTAALASQLEGTAYEGKHGMVVFKSTVFDDRREQRGSELLTINTPNASKSLSFRNQSIEDSSNLPDPDLIAVEIVEDLEAALQQFAAIAADLKSE